MRLLAADRRAARLALPLTVLLAAGCGGGSEPPTASTTPTASSTPSPTADPTRPSGAWTLAAWLVKRSDAEASPTARVLLTTLTPSCDTGPCDLTLAPAGVDGGFREAEAPVVDDGSAKPKPITLRWDGTSYTGTSETRSASCSPKGRAGESVPGGYTFVRKVSMTYVAPSGDTGPRVHGTIADTTTGTKAGKAKGCTDFVATEAFGGSPTGSLDVATPLTGEYEASLSATATNPKSLASLGQPLWLGTMAVAAGGASITGLTTGTAPLAGSVEGWGGKVPSTPLTCTDPRGAATAKGADAVETFSGLHPVALTADGKPVFAGSWALRADPNATGLKAGCSLTTYEGRIYLVPSGAGR